MTMSFDETPVCGSVMEGGTIREPKRRSTVPSLQTLIRLGSSFTISLLLVGVGLIVEAIEGRKRKEDNCRTEKERRRCGSPNWEVVSVLQLLGNHKGRATPEEGLRDIKFLWVRMHCDEWVVGRLFHIRWNLLNDGKIYISHIIFISSTPQHKI